MQYFLSNLKTPCEIIALEDKQHPFEIVCETATDVFEDEVKIESIRKTMKHFFKLQGIYMYIYFLFNLNFHFIYIFHLV